MVVNVSFGSLGALPAVWSVGGWVAGVCGLALFVAWVEGESPPLLPQAASATARIDKEKARDRYVMIFSLSSFMDNVKDNVKIFFGCEDVHSLMFFIIFQ
ncbi:hypothetical protein HMPREF2936_03785 [Neisseria sp. HMSC064F04]|uniref:Uncharacterized protein n=1 Tax=Neisseria mucosa (strain ATCC 25996 / DSM 4631 / NCTC 10774 / M26) TaxID=546266 RepID=D2ZTE4_NEIM2|nr:hypothetical protein NEIMUCOT_03881 [Neisseria mucosa ATCC 25996]OFM99203.1 hypothetical protein HMPREF2638_05330 [Neisseria sp. HMSC055F11]OFN38949.1 hypothetical protein HMPREF2568_01520 [Neisseria sp. HMSC059F02]OHR42639.1 hypothetical protein HMPREF2936_03785 [Neisseria sp. HMSC064F04]